MKILITGAGGRIGQLLRADLAEHDLRLLARSPIEDAAEEVVIGDVSDLLCGILDGRSREQAQVMFGQVGA